ncbi:MAG: hypothetical protein V6Z82_06750 [Flavobacteriales bacterium]
MEPERAKQNEREAAEAQPARVRFTRRAAPRNRGPTPRGFPKNEVKGRVFYKQRVRGRLNKFKEFLQESKANTKEAPQENKNLDWLSEQANKFNERLAKKEEEDFEMIKQNFKGYLKVWKMKVAEGKKQSADFENFADYAKKRFARKAKNEARQQQGIKASFEVKVKFERFDAREGIQQEMNHYFVDTDPEIFNQHSSQQDLEEYFDKIVERIKGKIEAWSAKGSGWKLKRIMEAYIKVARYQPLKGGSYISLPEKLANKLAVINVKNFDNECLKWALRAALFPPADGKNPQRTSKYPRQDGINYEGIDFPTPVRQIDKLERQNPHLAINVFGWNNKENCVTVHRQRKKELKEGVKEIDVILVEDGENQHYCWVKSRTALLRDQTAHNGKKEFCMMCMTCFTTKEKLKEHEKFCNGISGRPVQIEMPKEGENTQKFQKHQNVQRVPYLFYTDFEANVNKIQKEEGVPDEELPDEPEYPSEEPEKSYTKKLNKHEATGFSVVLVGPEGAEPPVVYRGKNAAEKCLEYLITKEKEIREKLKMCEAKTKGLPNGEQMTKENWEDYKGAEKCCLCVKTLMKENFLDSVPVWTKTEDGENYYGQMHKKCFYREKQNSEECLLLKGPKEEDKQKAKEQKKCKSCCKNLIRPTHVDKVINRCQTTGNYRGAAHEECYKKTKINPKTVAIPVIAHNLRGYDSHLIMQAMADSKEEREIRCIPNNMEKYISFSFGNLRFIDSYNFLPSSLSKLVEDAAKEDLKITKKVFGENFEMMVKKGVYPYEWMDSWEKFEEKELPQIEEFYSNLNEEGIGKEDYEHAQNVWEAFGCKDIGDYHNIYVKSDACLLADVFENFRKISMETYGLDPAHNYTLPGYSWDALFKMTKSTTDPATGRRKYYTTNDPPPEATEADPNLEVELLTDPEMYTFVERGIRGGISMASQRYAKANNPYLEGYDKSRIKTYIIYLDANNLYGSAMSEYLPIGNFKWLRNMEKFTEEKVKSMKKDGKRGAILEVSLKYPKELHDAHNGYPLAPEKIKIGEERLSPYQKGLLERFRHKPTDCEKLTLTLEDKNNYVLHYRNLQFYLEQGMKLTKVHKVLEFDQEKWMEPYIRMNTELRKKAKSDFEKNFYKLMNNSVFGKTMENLRNRTEIKIVRGHETAKLRKLLASPLYARHTIFTKKLTGIEMRKTRLLLNKPVYTGMTILENSKLVMYDFYYNNLKKKYGENVELLYTDTDSLLLEVQTEDFYEDMLKDKESYDTSNYPKEHKLFSTKNKKVLGKMKDECAVDEEIDKKKYIPVLYMISECVCLRPKMYSLDCKKIMGYTTEKKDQKSIKKAKGVKKCVIKKRISHENFKEALCERKEAYRTMNFLRSYGHEIHGIQMNKLSISPYDSKRWICDNGITTLAYGHYKIAEQKKEAPTTS